MSISINTNQSAATAPQVGQTMNATITGVKITGRNPNIDRATGEPTGETSPIVLVRFQSSDMPKDWVGIMGLAAFQNGTVPDKARGGKLHLNEAQMLANLMLSANPEHESLESIAGLSEYAENTAILALKGHPILATLVDGDIEIVREDGSRQTVNDYDLAPDPETDAPAPAEAPESTADTDDDIFPA